MFKLGNKMDHKLIYFGHHILKEKAKPVDSFNAEIKELAEEMFHIMKKSNGIGLAGPQINEKKRIITIDLTGTEDEAKLTIINPEIIHVSDDLVPYEEGCLSIPGIFENVMRPSHIKVKGYDINGKEVKYDVSNVLARVFQHEIDHLNGILFIDRIEDYIKKEYTKELKKIKKLNKE